MKHIKPFLLEERYRQILKVYYISQREIKNRSHLPYWDFKGRIMVVTYPIIKDAISMMTEGDLLYMLNIKASVASENETREWLENRGYDADEFIETLETGNELPKLDALEDTDFTWTYDGFEAGDRVLFRDLSSITETISEVNPSEVQRIRTKFGLN
jgi:hypothetical protein